MNELGKTVISGKLRIVTPVHIGGAQEKHMQKGLDYLTQDGKVYFLDEKRLINHFKIEKYSTFLSQGKLDQLCSNINLRDYSYKIVNNISGEIGSDIKTNIKNALSNKPIIPGSSLKGGLRSVFYNYIVQNNPPKMEVDVFGKISEDIFRFLIVNDVQFNETSYINTKTYNLQGYENQLKGGWKHELKGKTNSQFKSSGFTFPHEVISMDDVGDFKIIINKTALDLASRASKVKTNQFFEEIFKGKEEDILRILQTYMSAYLLKELDFFTKYEADQSNIIVDELNRLIRLNEQAPLVRLGLGSGYHAMTGDTHNGTHEINGIGNRNRGLFNGQDSSKSRKLAFKGSGENLQFYPMGFIQIMTDEYYENHYKATFLKRNEELANAEKYQL
ncbi:MAG TPA: type III-A CRISPR-associated RAMP protein Csm5 [Saprospiraceae bacterium]|nr:type III-A CRISPR-associated RAMP protein Csm5 [Saprospiraceae bacterium]